MPELLSTVLNASALVEAVSAHGPLRASAVARISGLDTQSTRRALSSLCERNVLRKTEQDLYVLGPFWRALARSAKADLRRQIDVHISELASATGETVTLVRPRGRSFNELEVVSVDSGSRDLVRVEYQVGYAMQVIPTAAGKIAAVFGAQTAPTVHFEASELASIREDGFAQSDGVLLPGMHGIAIPVTDSSGILVAILSVISPEHRQAQTEDILRQMRDRAEPLSALVTVLGWSCS